MMKRKVSIFVLCFLLITCFVFVVQVLRLNEFEGGFLTDTQEVQKANEKGIFGPFLRANLAQSKGVSSQSEREGKIVFKLFGFLPVKTLPVKMLDDEDYYVGGAPIGLSINTDGAIVFDSESASLAKNVREGDIIKEIDGKKIEDLTEISDYLQNTEQDVQLTLMRKNKIIKMKAKTYEEDERKKLGLWVRNDVAGIGTLSFANTKTLKYGALGHAMVENLGGNTVPVTNGKIYKCELLGIEKGRRNKPGQLRCVFTENCASDGCVESNGKFGVKGVLEKDSALIDKNKTAKLAGRFSVKPGKAKIVSNVSGISEEYDIEIIKASYQKSAGEKSLVFRVIDKRLIDMTGGIVQGMSGSPIMQDGKIVGVVTHVFTSDATKGYGVYVDWMV